MNKAPLLFLTALAACEGMDTFNDSGPEEDSGLPTVSWADTAIGSVLDDTAQSSSDDSGAQDSDPSSSGDTAEQGGDDTASPSTGTFEEDCYGQLGLVDSSATADPAGDVILNASGGQIVDVFTYSSGSGHPIGQVGAYVSSGGQICGLEVVAQTENGEPTLRVDLLSADCAPSNEGTVEIGFYTVGQAGECLNSLMQSLGAEAVWTYEFGDEDGDGVVDSAFRF